MATNSFVTPVTPEQAEELRDLLERRGWEFSTIPYARYKASGDHVNVVVYESGKLVTQGKGVEEFVLYTLEPEILHSYGFVAAETAAAEAAAEVIDEHGGIDESGKGDFFGPLVVGGVCVNDAIGKELRKLGVCDSKLIHSSKKIFELSAEIRRIALGRYSTLVLMPETYNRLYNKIGNLNRLLAWGHARIIENLLEQTPECPRMLSDKFGNDTLIRRALMERGRKIQLDQHVRAESDVAVAAASILAREGFLRGMAKLGADLGIELQRGAGPMVKVIGTKLLEKFGPAKMPQYAKCHFRTARELLGLPPLEE